MKLTENKQKKLDEIKKQISMESDYLIDESEYPIIYSTKKKNIGFANIIVISILLIIIVSIIIIII